MRRIATLAAGTALGFAALGLAAPLAQAADYPAPTGSPATPVHPPEHTLTPAKPAMTGTPAAPLQPAPAYLQPQGAMRTGSGGASGSATDIAGIAAGGAMVVAGLGLGAHALRRRGSAPA